MPMLGDIFLNTVYSEKPDRSVKTTEHPIEGGENIVDHIERRPIVLEISGVVTGPDAALRLNRLEHYRKRGTPLVYRYRNLMSNMIIEQFRSTHDSEVDKAFKFDIKLKEVKIAKPTVLKALKLPQRVQTSQVGNKGRQQLTAQEKAILKDMGHDKLLR
jgi:hypothetical protein